MSGAIADTVTISGGALVALVVLGILVCFSVYSWTLIFAKWQSLRGARRLNALGVILLPMACAMSGLMPAAIRLLGLDVP